MFPEPIRKETPPGGHPRCEVCQARWKKDPRHNFSVKSTKHYYTFIHALKYTAKCYSIKINSIRIQKYCTILHLSLCQSLSQSYKYNEIIPAAYHKFYHININYRWFSSSTS